MDNRTLHAIIFGLTLLSCWSQAGAQTQVAVSIRPLQLIAQAVTEGISEPALVIDATQDAHHPSLRPSQRQAMDQALVFLWAGPQLETGMDGIVGELPGTVLTALQAPGLARQMIGDGLDPHIWLDTHNAAVIADLLAGTLAQADPDNSERYQANAASFRGALENLAAEISALLRPDGFPPFAVYHNGYQYFENQFGLQHVTSFTNNEEVQPGIRRVLAIQRQLDESGVNCIVVGPSQNTAFLDNQLDRDGMRYVTIDVLGHDVAPGRDAYVRFMRNLAQGFTGCRD